MPPKRTILSPTIQQHWRRRGHGPLPFGSIFFQVNDTEEKFKWRFSACWSRYPPHCTPHLLRIILFFYTPPPWHPAPSPLKAVLFTRIKLPEVMEVPVQPCVIATKNVQLSIVANWEERGLSSVGALRGTGTRRDLTDTHRLSGSGAPRAALGWVDSPARPQSSCQRHGCGCSKSHCWNGMAQNGRPGPQRHTCDCPALWPSGSPSSVQGCPGQEQRWHGEGVSFQFELPMVS